MKKRAIVAGGAGFVGSHLVDRLLEEGFEVVCLDNLITGNPANLKHILKNKDFSFIEADVAKDLPKALTKEKFDFVFHLASPASPRSYGEYPLETILANTTGTQNLLEFCRTSGASFLFASSSEVYGEPEVHPQTEDYHGSVNPVGPRACYDESKRLGETLTSVYHDKLGVDTRIVRIFNTYGPRMQNEDGRIVPNFITQALYDKNLTIYGTGRQTRSFCYVSDMVEGIVRAAFTSGTDGEVFNLGNPEEVSVLELAKLVKTLTGTKVGFVYEDLPEEDPTRRKPDIGKAKSVFGWEPKVGLAEGLKLTIGFFKNINESSYHNSHI